MTCAYPIDSLDLHEFRPCRRQAFLLRVGTSPSGSVIGVPVNVVTGVRPGPKLAAVAGVHGDEVEGVMAILQIWAEVRPEQLGGTLVLVPVANPSAFAVHSRTSPLDDLDLNRLFPGRAEGRPSERLAHVLYSDVIRQVDFLFSMHSWYAAGRVLPYAELGHLFPMTQARSLAAATACGFDLVRISHWHPGVMTRAANEAGIAGIEVEIGGMGVSHPDTRARYKQYLLRLLRHLGMIEGKAPPPTAPRVVRHLDVISPAPGILNPAVDLGQEVKAGEPLATVHDLNCRSIAEIRAPEGGLVAAIHEAASVTEGTHVFRLFQDVEGPFQAAFTNQHRNSGRS